MEIRFSWGRKFSPQHSRGSEALLFAGAARHPLLFDPFFLSFTRQLPVGEIVVQFVMYDVTFVRFVRGR